MIKCHPQTLLTWTRPSKTSMQKSEPEFHAVENILVRAPSRETCVCSKKNLAKYKYLTKI